MTTTLNAGQQYASERLYDFLFDPNLKFFGLRGPAGTGKTHLLHYLQSVMMQTYEGMCQAVGAKPTIQSIAFTATTNKAAEVLNQGMGVPVTTVHSFLRLKMSEGDDGRQRISKRRDFMVHSNTLLIIDEAGMCDSKLFQYINDATDGTCKVLFVGDPYQMAPVGEGVSPAFSDPAIPQVELTQQMRNSGQPALMAVCEQMRETVRTGIFKPIPLVPGVIEQLEPARMQALVDGAFAHEGEDARILCYTNNRVKEYSDYIRHLRGRPAHFVTGEQLIVGAGFEALIQDEMDGGRTVVRPVPAETELIVESVSSQPSIVDYDGFEIEAYALTLRGKKKKALTIPAFQATDAKFLKDIGKYYVKQTEWRKFYQLQAKFPDMRIVDVSTVYKAQGSTYDYVIIDLDNLGKCTNADQAARMLYVAFSRARSQVFLFGTLPDRFLGA